MWLFTIYGFFSVTVSKQDPKKMQIRARAKHDLERLINFAGRVELELGPIIETPKADYHFRLLCNRLEWQQLATELAQDVNYSNFKEQIKDPKRHRLYEQVWGTMMELQYQDQAASQQDQLFQQYDEWEAEQWHGYDTEARIAELENEIMEEDLPGWDDDPTSPFYDPLLIESHLLDPDND